jgi:hypothetical protein
MWSTTGVCAILWMLASAGPGAHGSEAPADERQVRAAFVTKFPQFVQWPAQAWQGRTTVEVCVAGSPEVVHAVRDLAAGQLLESRPLVVREVHRDEPLDACHVLYLALPPPDAAVTLRRAGALPILTVGEHATFLEDGGIVRLTTRDGRVRFEINLHAAARARLHVSSHLLRLALSVKEAGS